MTDIDHNTLPTGAAPEWYDLAAGFGHISNDQAFRLALGHAYRAGVSADDIVGIQFSAPNDRGYGPVLFFGLKHGPFRMFAEDGERPTYEPAGKPWPSVTDAKLTSWENERIELDRLAAEASRQAGADGDQVSAPHHERRANLEAMIFAAPCTSQAAAAVKARTLLAYMDPDAEDWESIVMTQIAGWLHS